MRDASPRVPDKSFSAPFTHRLTAPPTRSSRAVDECNATAHPGTTCLWNNDGSTDQEVWAQRRHIGKVYEIAQTFAAVFGQDQVPTRIRPIYADWVIYPQRYNETLTWFNATYGPPSK
jgi:hypothetical protein